METKAGLLPLYIALYDEAAPQMRPKIESFYAEIADRLEAQGVEIVRNPVCCVEDQFKKAVTRFEAENVDAIITLHLAYSPSLESEKVLASTKLPIVVLDTTPDYLFDHTIDPDAINYNHGIHGVQDMCCLLVKNGKDFNIFAGHYEKSDVIARVAKAVKSISAAKSMKGMRVGKVGKEFKGMGDFKVSPEKLKKDFGIEVVEYDMKKGAELYNSVTADEIEKEFKADCLIATNVENISRDNYDATEKVALAVRKWLEKEKIGAFTINFQDAGSCDGFKTMPFSEASKAMARGIGYAGEGDTLTAAVVGALIKAFPDTTFAEMFCPDWKNNNIFFSHMGEYNLKAAAGKPHMIIKDFPYAPGFDPTCIMGHFKAGKACFVNLAPRKSGYTFIICEGETVSLPEKIGGFENSVSGWFKPGKTVPEFLEGYSSAGGTHHGAIVYGADAKTLALFGKTAGFDCVIL